MRLAIAAVVLAATVSSAFAQTRVQSGILRCVTKPTFGVVIGSVRKMDCLFRRSSGEMERYEGLQGRVGVDIGVQAGANLLWAVYGPSKDLLPGSLAGFYGGSSSQVAVGVGAGANMLWGGSRKTISLQPLSVEGQAGFNAALGIASLKLTYLP